MCHVAEKTQFQCKKDNIYSFRCITKLLHFGYVDFASEVQYLTVLKMFGQISRSLYVTGLFSNHGMLQNARENLVDFVIEM